MKFEHGLLLDTGTIPEYKKNGKFYRFVWDYNPIELRSMANSIVKQIDLSKSYLTSNVGQVTGEYGYIRKGSDGTNNLTTHVNVYMRTTQEVTNLVMGKRYWISAVETSIDLALQWAAGFWGICTQTNIGGRFASFACSIDTTGRTTYGNTNGSVFCGTIYDASPTNWNSIPTFVGGGFLQAPMTNNILYRADSSIVKVSASPIMVAFTDDTDENANMVGTSTLDTAVTPYINVKFSVTDTTLVDYSGGVGHDYQGEHQDIKLFAEFYMGDV